MKSFKQFLSEASNKYTVEVQIRDARKAQDIAQDMFRGTFKQEGSNYYIFKKRDDYEDFKDALESAKLGIIEDDD